MAAITRVICRTSSNGRTHKQKKTHNTAEQRQSITRLARIEIKSQYKLYILVASVYTIYREKSIVYKDPCERLLLLATWVVS